MKSKEYFKFIISKIENELRIYPGTGEFLKCMFLLGILKSSENTLKDIHTISRIQNLKNLGNYLIFIYKKTETGEVRFDNLLENLKLDKEYIVKEILKNFNLDNLHKQEREAIKKEKPRDDKITTEIKRILAESKFKVEEIDNELVAEEFIESNTRDDGEYIVRGNYLELIQPDSVLEEASVFTLPHNADRDEKEDGEIKIEDNDVFSLPIVDKTESTNHNEDKIVEQVNTEELEEVKLDKIEAAAAAAASIAETVLETNDTKIESGGINIDEEDKNETKKIEEGKEYEEKVIEDNRELEETVEENKGEIIFTEAKSQTEEKEKEEKEPKETEKDSETADVENSVYMKYETELLSSNVLLRTNLVELGGLDREVENYTDKQNILIKEIVDSSFYLAEYSGKMSFEIITSIYALMNSTFSIYGKTVGSEIVALFLDSINLVESLIKGEDFAGYDNVMKSLDVLKRTLIDARREESKIESKIETEELEDSQLPERELDTNERQKMALIKQNIIEIENVFKSIEDIKGKYQAYEALRRLSHTFTHLKELVNVANSLEIRKLAQLAEASYIFVKFVQNYRMDPFENEIAEVFKYIIYNFKLIFLDKPTKDIDLLISYLNDPVKIFEKKEK